jgi:CubicO group peptidase (beta-lactamase class C family)
MLIPELDQLAIDAMADWKVPGAALAVVKDGKLALVKAYGQRDLEANLPVTPSTQFLIGSITKSFTATAVALLHGEDRLDWTKPVRDYVPEFRLHDPVATDRVTVRDLLCHHTGLPRHDWVWLPGDRSTTELLAPLRHLELSRDIRAAWQYNNLCYNVAGLLIERVGGRSYQDFIRGRLADRLGMTVSFTLEELEASSDAACPYMMYEDERLPAMRLPIRTIAAGAINTSVTDLAQWMRLHLAKGEYEGERLLSAALIDELHAPRVYCPSSGPPRGGIRRGALWVRLPLRLLSRRPFCLAQRRPHRLVRADDAGAGFWPGRRHPHQSQSERGAAYSHPACRRSAARPRSDRLARATP